MNELLASEPTKYTRPVYEYAVRPRDEYGDCIDVFHAGLDLDSPADIAIMVSGLRSEYDAASIDLWLQERGTIRDKREGGFRFTMSETEIWNSEGADLQEGLDLSKLPRQTRDHVSHVLAALAADQHKKGEVI